MQEAASHRPAVDGLLVIDKPKGLSSHDVVQRVRRLLRTKRVGHAGTLDPLATGVLLVAVGEATRLVEFLMEGEKTYRTELRFGEITDTQDSEGRLLERRPTCDLKESDLRSACREMTGNISQIPPMYSALKRDGVPLYRLARKGEEVERYPRTVTVSRMEVADVRLPEATLVVDCSKGTYVRTLCHDLGERLGPGAHMTVLRRTRSGAFGEAEAVSLEELSAASAAGAVPLIPLDKVLRGAPVLTLAPEAALRLRHGIPPEIPAVAGNLPEIGAVVQLIAGGNLLGVARFDPLRREEKRGDFVLLRVFQAT